MEKYWQGQHFLTGYRRTVRSHIFVSPFGPVRYILYLDNAVSPESDECKCAKAGVDKTTRPGCIMVGSERAPAWTDRYAGSGELIGFRRDPKESNVFRSLLLHKRTTPSFFFLILCHNQLSAIMYMMISAHHQRGKRRRKTIAVSETLMEEEAEAEEKACGLLLKLCAANVKSSLMTRCRHSIWRLKY